MTGLAVIFMLLMVWCAIQGYWVFAALSAAVALTLMKCGK
jgi:hypothetical protein